MANSTNPDQTNFQSALFALSLDRDAPQPLHAQLTEALRHLILSGTAPPGARLPASRVLAGELSVSRMTATSAFEQLLAEGYLVTRRGAGTFVAADLPHLSPPAQPDMPPTGPDPTPPDPARPFHTATPDLALFPHAAWARHLERAWRRPSATLLALPDPLGFAPLRAAIAAHLAAWRGLRVGAGQVVITSGATEAFDLVARGLLTPGDAVLTEDPGFAPMMLALRAAGLVPHPQPVDGDGFDIATAAAACPAARAALVTPSRHYPLGITLPLARRLALLDWAAQRDAVIIEDDYDSEFRYVGQPLPALSALDDGGRVFYVGSFSKLLSPALRLGYLVVPTAHLPAIRQAATLSGPRASMVPQPALASFMASGEFATHLRRMRRVYARRQAALIAALRARLPDHLRVAPDPSGMHLIARPGPALPDLPDHEISAAAKRAGLTLRPLSAYFAAHPQQGFVLGYAGFDEAALTAAVERLAQVLQALPGRLPSST